VAFAPYVTLPEFKAWVKLDDTVDDAVMASVIESVSRWIDDYCGRHFWQDGSGGSPMTRTFVPTDCRQLLTDDLVSVASLKTDEAGDGTFEVTWAAADFQLQPVNRPTGRPYRRVEAIATLRFPIRSTTGSRADRVEITGVWGWPAVPDVVKQAAHIQASRILKRRYSPEGVAGFGDFGAVRVSSRLDPDVKDQLTRLRRRIVG